MKTIKKLLLTFIAMLAVIVTAFSINKLVELKQDREWEKERTVRVLEINESAESIRSEIEEISQLSVEEIENYINEHTYVDEESSIQDDSGLRNISDEDEWSGENAHSDEITDVTDNSIPENNEITVDISGNEIPDESVSGNEIYPEADVSGNEAYSDNIGGTVSGNSIFTLKERQSIMTSYEETQRWIEADNAVLNDYADEFKDIKITCLGDSITEAANLNALEDYQQYSYPSRLSEYLETMGAVNLGIGGSSLGRYWENAFCDRYTDIPKESDLIIIMGGTNDGFCLTEDLVGNIEERKPRTLYGDVNDLMSGLKENYPDSRVIFMTPLPNLLHDVLRKERENLLPQTVVTDCIRELAAEYDFEVIDLYNSNFFDSHDAAVVANYIPDSVHPNIEGYDIFARHIAAELLRIYKDMPEGEENNVIENDGSEMTDTVSENALSVSDDALSEENEGESDEESIGEENSKSDMKADENSASPDENTENTKAGEATPTPESKRVIIKRD